MIHVTKYIFITILTKTPRKYGTIIILNVQYVELFAEHLFSILYVGTFKNCFYLCTLHKYADGTWIHFESSKLISNNFPIQQVEDKKEEKKEEEKKKVEEKKEEEKKKSEEKKKVEEKVEETTEVTKVRT